MNDTTTITLDKTEVSLFQRVGGVASPCLILYSGPDVGQRFDLESGQHLIGRSRDARVQIDSPGISRRHAELQVFGNKVVVRDLGSSNRTRVNDVRIDAPTILKQGDLLRLANVVLRFHDRQSLDALLHDRIYRLATTDAGTGAFNRKYLQDTLRHEVARAQRGQQTLAVICYDLDHFKRVNDTYGHAAGDQVLRDCTHRVQEVLRGTDVLCRVGGEEFAVLLPHTDARQAAVLAERLRAAVADRTFGVPLSNAAGRTTVQHRQSISLGVAEWSMSLHDGQDMLELADRRLYQSKHDGRNRVTDNGCEFELPR